MPTSYTSLLGLALPVTGELAGTWGETANDYITKYIDSAVAGAQTISGSQTAVTLSVTNGTALVQAGSGATGSAQYQIINCTGNPAGLLTITVPAQSKAYLVINATSTSQSVKVVGSGPTTGVTMISGEKALIAWNGSDFVKVATTVLGAGGSNTQVQYNSSGVLAGSANLTFDGTSLTLGGNPTLSAGTANGVAYLNGSKVLTTGSALTFDGTEFKVNAASGNVLVQPSNVANAKLYLRHGSIANNNGFEVDVSSNTIFLQAGSEAMRLTSTGLGIGTSSPATRLSVDNTRSDTAGTGWFTYTNAAVTSGKRGMRVDTNNNYWFDYYNGSSWSGQMVLDSSGNLGLGVTPSGSWSGQSAFQVNTRSAFAGSSNFTAVATNAIATGTGWTANYLANGTAALYTQSVSTGAHAWFNAASGTAGNAISFTQAMTLDASGNLLIGTTTSNSFKFKVSDAGGAEFAFLPNDSGVNNFTNYNRSTSAYVPLSLNAADVRFSTSGTERARITSGGDLLVGTTSSAFNADVGIKITPAGDGATYPRFGIVSAATTDGASVNYSLYSTGAAAYRFYVGLGGTVYATNTTISAISDQRFKENIRDLDVGLNTIMALKPRKFDWKAGKGKDIKDDRGFIAQEFEQVFPDLVDQWADPAPEGEAPYKSVRQDLIPVLVKAIQEQQALINDLRARVAQLEGTP